MKVNLYSFVGLYSRGLDTLAHILIKGSEHAARTSTSSLASSSNDAGLLTPQPAPGARAHCDRGAARLLENGGRHRRQEGSKGPGVKRARRE